MAFSALPLLMALSSAPAQATVVADHTTRITVRGFEVGRIAVKPAHARLMVPASTPTLLRFGHIFAMGGAQLPSMPILAYVIEHPEGTFVVDTGEVQNAPITDADRNLLRMDLPAQAALVQQMKGAGVDFDAISGIVLTHLHVDHVGGVSALPAVPVYTSRVDVELGGQIGGRPERLPANTPLRFAEDLLVDHGDDVDAVFGRSHFLTSDGAVRLVPAPGHTPGALNVLVRGDDVDLLLSGDAGFTAQHICEGHLLGIHVDLDAAKETLARARTWAHRRPTVMLPSHDDNALGRLTTMAVTTIDVAEPLGAPLALGADHHFHWTRFTSARPASVWRRWTDVTTWPSWDTELSQASLPAGFVKGAAGTLKTKDNTDAGFVVVDVVEGVSATYTTALPFGSLVVTRTLRPQAGGTLFTHDVAFQGWSSSLFSRALGRGYRQALPVVMAMLARQAEQDGPGDDAK